MNDKYEEIFKQFWGEDYNDSPTKTATCKKIDCKKVNDKVVKLFTIHLVSGMLPELKETLARLTLDYTKNHLGRNNQEQHNAKHDIDLIAMVIDLLGNYR